jgi:hypothetical protein
MSRLKLVFVSLFAVGAIAAVAAASASATEFYNSSGVLITGTLNIVSSGGEQKLKGEVAGVKLEVICTSVSDSGTLENVGGMGLGSALLLYAGCSVHAPKPKNVEGCEVGSIHTVVHALAEGTSSAPLVKFTPASGTKFVGITFVNCKNTGLNGEHEVTGFAIVKANNTTSELEANTGSGELVFAGNEATYEGKDHQEMEGGGGIKVE